LSKEIGNKNKILNDILGAVSKVVVGMDEIKQMLLVALVSQGHVLIEGLPGTGKTTLSRSFAQAIGGRFKRIQGVPDMLPADILGFYHYRADGGAHFVPGPIFANVILVDELNRLTTRTQAALLEAMQERQVTIERETHPLEQPSFVVAAQLPYGSAGTHPLGEVHIDRFMFRLWSGFLSKIEEDSVLRDIDELTSPQVPAVATTKDILELQELVKQVHVAESIRGYILEIVNKLRNYPDVSLGPSARASIALYKGSRGLAFLAGRDFVIPDDVKRLILPALSHRVQVTSEAEMENVTAESLINKAVSEVPVPKTE
jgi:MoxR-like ATPase